MRPVGELSVWQRITFGIPQIAISVTSALVGTWLTYFYLPPDGSGRPQLVSAGVFAAILLAGRFVDAFADPLIGYWSDRTKSRLGRRLPFLLFGSPLLAFSFALMFFPPDLSVTTRNGVFLALTMFAYWAIFTLVVAPYYALLPEIARSDRERLLLSTAMAVFMMVGTILGAGIGFIETSLVDGITVLGIHMRTGIQACAAGAGVLSLFLFWVPLINIREQPRDASKDVPAGLVAGVLSAFRNPAFRTYLGIACFVQAGLVMLGTGLPYVCSQVLEPHYEVHAEVPTTDGSVAEVTGRYLTGTSVELTLPPNILLGSGALTIQVDHSDNPIEVAVTTDEIFAEADGEEPEVRRVTALELDSDAASVSVSDDDVVIVPGQLVVVRDVPLPRSRLVKPGAGEGWVGILFGILTILALIWMPLVNKLAQSMGKRRLMTYAGIAFGIGLASIATMPLFADPGVAMIVVIVALSFPASAAFILPNAIYGDVVDLDAEMTGMRREGLYTGASAVLSKAALGLAGGGAIMLLKLGNSHMDPTGILLIGPIGALSVFFGTWIFSKHPIAH